MVRFGFGVCVLLGNQRKVKRRLLGLVVCAFMGSVGEKYVFGFFGFLCFMMKALLIEWN